EVEPAREAGKAADFPIFAGLLIDHAHSAVAAFEDPQLPVMPTRRMRHRQPARDGLVAGDVNHTTAGALVVAPPAGRVGFTERGDVSWSAVAQAQAVEMTAVLRSKSRDERRHPTRDEAVNIAARRQAG